MTPSENRQTAWAYLVVSSEQQADTLDHQQSWAQEAARERGWVITETFRGVSSGRDGTRGLLEKLLEKLRQTPKPDRPQRILMIRLDRIGRGLGLEALAAIAEIARLGSIIHTRQDGDYTLTRASDSILPLMRVVTGAIENEARRDKAKAVFARRRATGAVVSNKRPYGLAMKNGFDTPQEPQAQSVRFAFELALNGFGLAAIGERLRSVAPPKLYVNGREHLTDWTNNRVRKLLRNRAYCGTLIEQATWQNVQLLMNRPSRARTRSKHPWPLSGSVHCACGRLLIGSILGSPPHRVYRCSMKAIHGRHITYSALRLEMAFQELLTRLKMTPELKSAYAETSTYAINSNVLKSREDEIRGRLSHGTNERHRSWRLNEDGLITDVDLARRLKELDSELRQLETDLDTVLQEGLRMAQQHDLVMRTDELIAEASILWRDGDVAAKQRAATSLARALGGLHVDAGTLQIGAPSNPKRFMKQRDS